MSINQICNVLNFVAGVTSLLAACVSYYYLRKAAKSLKSLSDIRRDP